MGKEHICSALISTSHLYTFLPDRRQTSRKDLGKNTAGCRRNSKSSSINLVESTPSVCVENTRRRSSRYCFRNPSVKPSSTVSFVGLRIRRVRRSIDCRAFLIARSKTEMEGQRSPHHVKVRHHYSTNSGPL